MDVVPPPQTVGTPQADVGTAKPAGATVQVLDGLLVAAVLTLAFLLASFPARNADLWGNLAVGRMVAHGQYPFGVDPFSALDPPPVWINPAWLTGLLLYSLFHLAGGPALVLLKAALVTVLAGVLLLTSRRDARLWLPAVGTTLALLAASPRLFLQPPVVSFLFLGVLAYMLHRPPRRQRWRLPVAVGVLFLLWANLDGGFVYGLLWLALWLIGAVLQQVTPLGERSPPRDAEAGTQFGVADLAVALVVAVAVCVINPYHVRVFQLPPEFAALTLPTELRGDPYFKSYFLVPFAKAYHTQESGMPVPVGKAPAYAYYLLIGLGLGSFFVNAGGWRWERALVWLAFAWLSMQSSRLVPYFAVVGAPVLVLNLQSMFARRQGASTEGGNVPARSTAMVRAYVLGLGRVLTLLVIVGLCALAWPGWLAGDYEAHQPQRRVGWRLEPDATMERLARQFADWYADPRGLRPNEERGFHLFPEFALFCAWFCPQEKGLIDARFTSPPAVALDYARLRRSIVGLSARGPRPKDEAPPTPPQELLRKLHITHIVLTNQPPVSLLAMALWRDPDQFPFWELTGRGVAYGWNDPEEKGPDVRAHLWLDPAARAFGNAARRVPSMRDVPFPPSLSGWDIYLRGLPPVPVEAYEASLWLAYRDSLPQRADMAAVVWQQVARLAARLDPTGGAPAVLREVVELSPAVGFAPQVARNVTLRALPGAAGVNAAPVLAVRAGRLAILANPDAYEPYLQLGKAYSALATDPELGWLQRRAALTLSIARMPIGKAGPADAFLAHAQLHSLYMNAPSLGRNTNQSQPYRDLALQSLEEMMANLRGMISPDSGLTPEEAKAQVEGLQQALDKLGAEVKRFSDDYFTRTAKAPLSVRVNLAIQYGLIKEALNVLREAEGKDLGEEGLARWLQLELYAGDVAAVGDLLNNSDHPPVPPHLVMLSAALVGDYDKATSLLMTIEEEFDRQATNATAFEYATAAARSLVVPPMPAIQSVLNPFFARIMGSQAQVIHERASQYHLWHGLLALEAGNLPVAKRQFQLARSHQLAQLYGQYLGN
jgi:hypothetical protein